MLPTADATVVPTAPMQAISRCKTPSVCPADAFLNCCLPHDSLWANTNQSNRAKISWMRF